LIEHGIFIFPKLQKIGEKNKTVVMKITSSNLLGISLLFTQKVIIAPALVKKHQRWRKGKLPLQVSKTFGNRKFPLLVVICNHCGTLAQNTKLQFCAN
jgi:hypothetical protein